MIRSKGNPHHTSNERNASKELYKKYGLDERPVKERSDFENSIECEETGRGDLEPSVESSHTFDLDKFEVKIYNNISQELQTDSSYVPSLESNIKLFKTAVQEIFDNFYTSMKDFEQYKRRFEEILSKGKDSVEDMEVFIIDVIQHIRSESSNVAVKSDCSASIQSSLPFEGPHQSPEGSKPTVEACRNVNDNSVTVTVPRSSSDLPSGKRVFNIYNFSCNRCVQIRLSNRDMMSEINIRDESVREDVLQAASAENVSRLKAKRLELARLRRQCANENENATEKDIPVKISNPKKNIHLDEDFAHEEVEDLDRSIIHKICRYLCRKLRRI
ncbi:unnamed protein product, partial [Iphiclides podalirius]